MARVRLLKDKPRFYWKTGEVKGVIKSGSVGHVHVTQHTTGNVLVKFDGVGTLQCIRKGDFEVVTD